MSALKQGLKTGVGPALIDQTRHPGDFFHLPGFVCEITAFEPRQAPDRAILTSLREVGFSLRQAIQYRQSLRT